MLSQLQIVEGLLDSLTPAGAVLAGNSVGGTVAVRHAIRRPDLVKGLMIIHGGGFVVIESGHLPHTTSPVAAAAELASLANTAFGAGSRTNDTRYRPPATKEQE